MVAAANPEPAAIGGCFANVLSAEVIHSQQYCPFARMIIPITIHAVVAQ
jgi:hypothetical protein